MGPAGAIATHAADHVLLALPPRLALDSIAFTPELPPALAAQWRATPVSYTHLDVYKRQVSRRTAVPALLPTAAEDAIVERLFQAGAARGSHVAFTTEAGLYPVSYTHLDVYKRQAAW